MLSPGNIVVIGSFVLDWLVNYSNIPSDLPVIPAQSKSLYHHKYIRHLHVIMVA